MSRLGAWKSWSFGSESVEHSIAQTAARRTLAEWHRPGFDAEFRVTTGHGLSAWPFAVSLERLRLAARAERLYGATYAIAQTKNTRASTTSIHPRRAESPRS